MAPTPVRPRLQRMLQADTVAVVGAGEGVETLGGRMATEVLRSPGLARHWFVNPNRSTVLDEPCLPSLAEVPEPVDLVLLGVPDRVLVDQVRLAAARGDGGAVVFGPAYGLREEVAAAAGGLELCGPGCMGFVDVVHGVRAIGYLEPHPLTPGPVALVSHSGSVFSAMLRTRRRLEYSVVVSSGQELVTTTADHLAYALSLEETRVVGLVLETVRDAPRLGEALRAAAERDVPVVALTVGASTSGGAFVGAHSGAVAGSDAAWEALCAAYGVHRCEDLAELTDSLEMFAIGRRARRQRRPSAEGHGIATVHDSGAERVLVADLAERLEVPFARLAPATTQRLASLLDPGLAPDNPLDVWGSGRGTEDLVGDCLAVLAEDPAVDAVVLAVDLVPEYDGDDSFPRALVRVAGATQKPVLAMSHLASAVDQAQAATLRRRGIPVLEGTRSGLRALDHLLAQAQGPRVPPPAPPVDEQRRDRWRRALACGRVDPLALVADYRVPVVPTLVVASAEAAVRAAARLGPPVVLKTAVPGVDHKVDVDGVRLGLVGAEAVGRAYADLAGRLGPQVAVQPQAPAGLELALGVVRDPLVGPLVVVAAGGTLVELLARRAVALPPVDRPTARAMLDRLEVGALLTGHRGAPPLPVDPVLDAVLAVSQLATELGDRLGALDVNPLVVHPGGAVAVDALVVPPRVAGLSAPARGTAGRPGPAPAGSDPARRNGPARGR